jgi:hypothetical protein
MAEMTAPTLRHQQQITAAMLAHLLTLPAPEVCVWWIGELFEGVRGQLSYLGGLDGIRVRLHQWAAILDHPEWTCEPYKTNPASTLIAVTGTHHGQPVEIWAAVNTSPGLDVSVLSAPPELDAGSGSP